MSTSTERMRALRARRAAAIEPDPSAPLRDADDLLGPAVEETLAALDLAGRDGAAAQLARQYARVIDQARDPAWAMRWIGPLLADALDSLGATPAAKARMGKGKPERPSGPSRLQLLRESRP